MRNSSLVTRHSSLGNEQGFILVVSLLLLLVVTVIGVLSISTSTTEVIIAGSQRLRELNLSSADGGIEISKPIIENTVYNNAIDLTKYPIITDNNLATELTGGSGTDNPLNAGEADISYTSGDNTILIDIDYYFSSFPAGAAMEFASGYEGLGKGAATGGAEIYYRINSYSRTTGLGAEVGVGAIYRYVAK